MKIERISLTKDCVSFLGPDSIVSISFDGVKSNVMKGQYVYRPLDFDCLNVESVKSIGYKIVDGIRNVLLQYTFGYICLSFDDACNVMYSNVVLTNKIKMNDIKEIGEKVESPKLVELCIEGYNKSITSVKNKVPEIFPKFVEENILPRANNGGTHIKFKFEDIRDHFNANYFIDIRFEFEKCLTDNGFEFKRVSDEYTISGWVK